MDRNNDFLKSLKVSEANQTKSVKEKTGSDRNVYTCLKLMGDTGRIQDFLLSVTEKETDEQNVSTSVSMNYFYTIGAELGKVEFDFREGRINSDELDTRINEICKKRALNFDDLLETVNQIDSLQKKPDTEKSIRLAQEIEKRTVQTLERKNKEIEK